MGGEGYVVLDAVTEGLDGDDDGHHLAAAEVAAGGEFDGDSLGAGRGMEGGGGEEEGEQREEAGSEAHERIIRG